MWLWSCVFIKYESGGWNIESKAAIMAQEQTTSASQHIFHNLFAYLSFQNPKYKDYTLELCLWTEPGYEKVWSNGWVVKHLTCVVKSGFKLMAPQTKQWRFTLWCNHSLSQRTSVFICGALFGSKRQSLNFFLHRGCSHLTLKILSL